MAPKIKAVWPSQLMHEACHSQKLSLRACHERPGPAFSQLIDRNLQEIAYLKLGMCLWYKCKTRAQVMQANSAYVQIIYCDEPAAWLNNSKQRHHQRGLPTSGSPTHSYLQTRTRDGERDPAITGCQRRIV